MRKRFFSTSLSLLTVGCLLTACSNVTVQRVVATDKTTNGVRYWMSAPYLMVPSPLVLSRSESYVKPPTLVPTVAPTDYAHPEEPSPFGPNAQFQRIAAKTPKPAAEATPPADTEKGPPLMGSTAGSPSTAVEAAPAPSPASSKPSGAPAASSDVPISVTWLPDYCEQYAISQSNVLSSASLNLALTQGWQLSTLAVTSDSTGVAMKLLDTISTLASAGASGGKPAVSAAAKTSQAQASSSLSIMVTTMVLPAGIYPLFKRENDDCDKPMRFAFEPFKSAQKNIEYRPVP